MGNKLEAQKKEHYITIPKQFSSKIFFSLCLLNWLLFSPLFLWPLFFFSEKTESKNKIRFHMMKTSNSMHEMIAQYPLHLHPLDILEFIIFYPLMICLFP